MGHNTEEASEDPGLYIPVFIVCVQRTSCLSGEACVRNTLCKR
jgi:hypothetical protein